MSGICEPDMKGYAQKAFDGLAKRVLRAFYETVKRVSKERLAENVQGRLGHPSIYVDLSSLHNDMLFDGISELGTARTIRTIHTYMRESTCTHLVSDVIYDRRHISQLSLREGRVQQSSLTAVLGTLRAQKSWAKQKA